MTNNIDNIIYSVSNTLNEVFGIFADVGTDGYTIRVRTLEEEAEYVQKIIETIVVTIAITKDWTMEDTRLFWLKT